MLPEPLEDGLVEGVIAPADTETFVAGDQVTT
jgi:hypothetical protein